MLDKNQLITTLGLIDTIHDFYDEDKNKKYLKLFRKFYLTFKEIKEISDLIKNQEFLSFIFEQFEAKCPDSPQI